VKSILAVVMSAMLPLLLLTACNGGPSSGDGSSAEVMMEEPVKSFLSGALPDDYAFYALEELLPITMDDLRSNGMIIGSKAPEGLLPSNVIRQLYGGGFPSGTFLSMDAASDGMDKFDGVPLYVCIGITPDGCISEMKEDGLKQIVLFSDEDANRVQDGALVKIDIK